MSVIGTGGNLPPQQKRIRATKMMLASRIAHLEDELKESGRLAYFALVIGVAIGAGAVMIGGAFK